ncbi:helix-turn-helix domain-containing protein [Tenacibaculum aquimarinum]|uniref:helix-turn-helix domain-containing protein n=1 Tax=Tenacibaculum aquimarinum TaxID=2910675 RepID=UPI001F0B61DA|nr:helix-turn-helix domain-containing protein [Tenacibaculum aquimarinum]MCH3885778.1 helix-turn-helix domain-containing protein [Tenacibaculum aquimarinum]
MKNYKLILLLFFYFITNIVVSQEAVQIQQKINQYISQAKLDSAKIYIKENLNKLAKKEDKSALNYQLVKVLFMQSSYNEALKIAFNSLDNIKDEQKRVNFNFMIGAIYSAITDYDKSIEYFDLVVKHNQNASLSVQTHLLLSSLYQNKKDSINAKKAITDAYKITKGSNINPITKNHVAMQYNFFNKNYELCKELNFQTIRDTTSFINSKSYAYSMIGDCLVKQDSLKEATTYFNEHLDLTIETKDPEQIKVAANKLIEVYEKLGNQEKANAYHKIYNEAVNDSLSFSAEKYRELYNVEKKRELVTAKNKDLKEYLIFSFIFIVLVSFGIYYYLNHKKTKKTLSSLLTKAPGKKIVVSKSEIEKIEIAIIELKEKQLFLKPNSTRKSVCIQNDIKSERYLSHFINEKYNKSFSVFINDLRVEYAYNRIQKDKKFRNYKIEEIAKECGFGSKKSFERAFLAKYNETPYKLISSINN